MECPYCQRELIKGHISTNGEVIKWMPEDRKMPLIEFRGTVNDDEIQLGSYGFFKGGNVEAYCCSDCQKVIIDY